jgi:hypothetical protein
MQRTPQQHSEEIVMNREVFDEVERKNREQENVLKERKKALKDLKKAQRKNARLARRNAKIGAREHLRETGYTGPVILLNPRTGEALGSIKCMNAKGMTYVDVGTLRSGGSPFTTRDKIPVKILIGKDGVKYAIPINQKTGKVPEEALFAKFLNEGEGGRNGRGRSIVIDIKKQADTVHVQPKDGFTPEGLLATGWWAHPGESDILGIDDPSSSVYGVLKGASSKSGMEAGNKIAILSPEEECIRKVLTDNFTGSELRNAVKDTGVMITTGSSGPGASGFYRYRQPGVDCPQIVLERDADEDTITHEFVHHLRFADETRGDVARTPYPVDEGGKLDARIWGTLSRDELASLKNIEEAATVAEATSRTRKPATLPTGYYQRIDGHSPANTDKEAVIGLYTHDRDVLLKTKRGSAPVRGKRASKRVNDRFLDTNISKLKMGGTPANRSVKKKREDGTMPKAKTTTAAKPAATKPAVSKPKPAAPKKSGVQTTIGKRKVR